MLDHMDLLDHSACEGLPNARILGYLNCLYMLLQGIVNAAQTHIPVRELHHLVRNNRRSVQSGFWGDFLETVWCSLENL